MAKGDEIQDYSALARHASKLKALGYRTLDEVVGAAAVAADRLADYLDEDVRSMLPQSPPAFAAQHDFPLGVALDAIPPLQVAFAMAAPSTTALPPSVNLVAQMPAIRDQARRGTCVAHAALAALENLRTGEGHFQDMSEQFLYWNCKQHDGIPTLSGTYLGIALPLLDRYGCCTEGMWSYVSSPIVGNESQNPPPSGAQTAAAAFTIKSHRAHSPTSVADFKAELVRGRCVAFSIPVFDSWYRNAAVTTSGDLVLPFPGEAVVGGHAMCICGYQDNPDEMVIGGGRFILRNSWDSAWGTACSFGVGYGTIPYAYITRFGKEAYSIE